MSKPVLAATEAMLFVSDFPCALAFYQRLGFAVGFTYGDPPYYGMVRRDQARLCLRLVCEPVFAGDVRERNELLSASILMATAAEVDALYSELIQAGVGFAQPIQDKPWGGHDFILRDPDGNLILFSGSAASSCKTG